MRRPGGDARVSWRSGRVRFQAVTLLAMSIIALAGCTNERGGEAPDGRAPGSAGGAVGPGGQLPGVTKGTPDPAPDEFVRFEDATAGSGIAFRHVNGATGRKYMLETLGSGLCVFDYDGDHLQDIYFVQSGGLPGFEAARRPTCALYRNAGGGRFVDVTGAAGVGGPDRYGFGCVAGDVDGDGDRDLYVTYYGPNVLYRNEGDGTFIDATLPAGVGDPMWGASAGLADYDGDGDLDLYVVNYVDYDLDNDLYCGENRPGYRSVCHPKNFDSQPDVLYRNRGDGTFEDVTASAGIHDRTGKGLGLVWGDYDGDGDDDLYVANDDTPNFLFRNRGDGTFIEVGELSGVALSEDGIPQAGMGVAMADYDNDGRPDIFVTNLAEETNELYHNEGHGSFLDATFTSGLGPTSLLTLGFGTFFFDADNDSIPDLFLVNGHIIDNVALYSDTITFEQPAHIYRGDGRGRFTLENARAGEPFRRTYVGRGAVPFDFDDDGDQDVLFTQNDRPAVLLRNAGPPRRHWVTLTLVGRAPNRDAIGARVTLEAAGFRRVRWARTASSYLSQGDRRIHFGLGDAMAIDRVIVRWPGRQPQQEEVFTEIPVDRAVTIIQGTGQPAGGNEGPRRR